MITARARGASILGGVALAMALAACSGARARPGGTDTPRDRCADRERYYPYLDGIALDGYLHDQVDIERVAALHRRWRINELAAAGDGGFLAAGGGSHLVIGPDGCPTTEREMDVLAVDDNFGVRWRWPVPEHVSPASVAGDGGGGAVVTFLTHEAAAVGQLQVADRAVGVLRLDPEGQLLWARVLAMGYQRLPHYLAVEPGAEGRIAVAMADRVLLDEQQDGTGTRGLRFWLLDADGEPLRELLRPWEGVSGVAWAGPGRLLLIGDRRGNLDPQAQPLISEQQDQQVEADDEPPRAVGIAELLEVDEQRTLWRREWGRGSPGWEARPTVGPDGALAFIDLLWRDRQRPPEPGRSHHRLVVLDAADGSVRWSRLMADDCGYLHVVAADPRNGDLVVARSRRCTGRDYAGTRLIVERLAPDGQLRWSEALGEPRSERRGSAFHITALAVAQSGRAALIGHARHMDIPGVSMTTDFEPYALVFDP